jgi:Family of unknown function (DUF6476)
MTSPDTPPDDSQLTPEAKHHIGRARRSFGFSIGLMLIGFIAVAAAIVYRVNRDVPQAPELATITVPAGAEVVSVVPAGNQLYVTYRVGSAQGVRVIDAATGAVIKQLDITAEGN